MIESILKKLLGFLPYGFPYENLCVLFCFYVCISFNDPIAYVYDVMMLNVLRYFINIKILTLQVGEDPKT